MIFASVSANFIMVFIIDIFITFLFSVSGDGNCLYNAVSVAISGKQKLCHTSRALTSAELFLNATFYASHPHFTSLLATEKI